MAHYWQEIEALTLRWVRRLSREKFSMLFTLVQPMLFWLIFFGNLFQRAADVQVTQAPNYISFLAAGVVVMTVLNNGLAGGVDLLFDKENGFLERLMTTPIHRSSVILSRFIFVMTITSLQVLVILGVSFLFGVQPATGFLGIAAILMIGMLFGVGLTAISMAMAFSVKSRRFLFGPVIPVALDDFLELGVGPLGGDARVDGISGALQSDDLGDRRGAAVDSVRLD